MPSTHTNRKREERALGAYVALMRSAAAVTARSHGALAEHGLTLGQFAALEALHHGGPMRPSEIAQRVLTSGGNMTMILDNLEKRGLVKRSRRKDDRRCITVALAPTGAELIAGILPSHFERIAAEFDVLTVTEQEELRRLCRKVGLAGATPE